MRFVALAIILLSLPVFMLLLNHFKSHRDTALIGVGAMMFTGGALQIDAALISWPLWPGPARGLIISPVDTLAIALIATRKTGGKGLPFFGLLGFYGFMLIASLASSTVPMATFFSVFDFLRTIVLFIAIGGEFARNNAVINLLSGLSIGLIVQSGFVISQKLDGVVQAAGTMGHQNILGMMTELALLPLLAVALEGKVRKIIYAGIIAGLIITAGGGSRATMGIVLASVAMLTTLSLARKPSPRKLKMIGLGVLAMAIAIPAGLSTLESRFGDKGFVTEEGERAAFERAASSMSQDYPFGIGANLYVTIANTQGYSEKAGVAWNQANRSVPVHNAYLLARAETSWIGAGAFLLMLTIPAIVGLRAAFANRRHVNGAIILGSSVALIAVIFHNFFEFAGHTYGPRALIIVNIVIVSALLRANKAAKRAQRLRSNLSRNATEADPVLAT